MMKSQSIVEYGSFSRNIESILSFETKIAKWLLDGDTGASSKTLAAIALDVPYDNYSVPHDFSDLGRCYRLIQSVPEVINRILMRPLEEIPYQNIMPYVWQWQHLAKMYEIFLAEDKNRETDNGLLLREFLIKLGQCKGDPITANTALEDAKAQVATDHAKKAEVEARRLAFEAQSKAEYDALPAIKKRPKLTDDIIRQGANVFTKAEFDNGEDWMVNAANEFVEHVVKNWDHDDGYDYAKKLERDGWDIDRDIVDRLDDLESRINESYRKAQRAWIADNHITPPYAIGTHVKFKHGRQELTGTIKETEAHWLIGQFVIEVDECFNYGKSCPIVNWEDVELTNLAC